MQADQLNQLILTVLDDNKAVDVRHLDVTELTDVTDTMIICSGTSSRHVQTLATKVVQAVKQNGVQPLSHEGENSGDWVLIDLADTVVHIMHPEAREFYSLEKLWTSTEKARSQAE